MVLEKSNDDDTYSFLHSTKIKYDAALQLYIFKKNKITNNKNYNIIHRGMSFNNYNIYDGQAK